MKELPYKKIYFVGIKGVGMAALAVIAKQAGYTVRGSDVSEKFITDSMLATHDISVDTPFETDTIDQFIDGDSRKTLVIATAAHGGLGNPQVVYAKGKNVDTLTFGQALGMFQYGTLLNRQDVVGISVAGSHGKTTTTAMAATVLTQLGEDPSYVIGTSEVGKLGEAGKLGDGRYFIVESDEYFSDLTYDRVPKFHYQHPFGAIITNIDFDHPDVFENLASVYTAFERFAENIQAGGVLALLGDNPEYQKIADKVQTDVRVVRYGIQEHNRYRAVDIKNSPKGVTYSVTYEGNLLGEIVLPVIGTHNAINSLSVIALLHSMEIPFDDISKGLTHFTGTKRRLELKGVSDNGAQIIDDYAHHPSEVRATITALKSAYPDKKIVCIFQPHTFSRTYSLVSEFSHAFEDVDQLLLLPIFASAREGSVDLDKQEKLYSEILGGSTGIFIENEQNVVEYCTKNFNSEEYLIVTMGAGDVYKIGETLIHI